MERRRKISNAGLAFGIPPQFHITAPAINNIEDLRNKLHGDVSQRLENRNSFPPHPNMPQNMETRNAIHKVSSEPNISSNLGNSNNLTLSNQRTRRVSSVDIHKVPSEPLLSSNVTNNNNNNNNAPLNNQRSRRFSSVDIHKVSSEPLLSSRVSNKNTLNLTNQRSRRFSSVDIGVLIIQENNERFESTDEKPRMRRKQSLPPIFRPPNPKSYDDGRSNLSGLPSYLNSRRRLSIRPKGRYKIEEEEEDLPEMAPKSPDIKLKTNSSPEFAQVLLEVQTIRLI